MPGRLTATTMRGEEREDRRIREVQTEMAAGNIELTREGGADRPSRKANGPDTETDMTLTREVYVQSSRKVRELRGCNCYDFDHKNHNNR